MKTSKIEWTERTWNPVTGCTKKSTGCLNCYAEFRAKRFQREGKAKYVNGFNVTLHENCLREPLSWKNAHMVFVCSMADIFNELVPFEFIDQIFSVIKSTSHIYQLLTKRPERMREYFSSHHIPSNVWVGTTVEAKSTVSRIDFIRDLNATVKFLSCEPLVEDLGHIDLTGIDWVIVGGETGYGARPMKEEWVFNIKNQVEKSGAKFFFKQWGVWGSDGIRRKPEENGKLLQGCVFQEIPESDLVIDSYPLF